MSSSTEHNNHSDVQDGTYLLPHGLDEQERLAQGARHLSVMMKSEVAHSPLDPSAANLRVVDVGCGPGSVTEYLGSRFKNAEVYGLDLSPPPDNSEQPQNVRYLKGNICTQKPHQWTASDGSNPVPEDGESFDLIFGRHLVCGITDWPEFIRSQYQLLKPGGYLEIHDLDWKWYGKTDHPDSDTWKWWIQSGKSKGIDYRCGSTCQEWMKDADFTDITVKEYRWPWGSEEHDTPEAQAFGKFNVSTMPRVYWEATTRMAGGPDLPQEKVRKMEEDFRKDFTIEPGQHMKYYVTIGRRPS